MSSKCNIESYRAILIRLRENLGKKPNHVTCPNQNLLFEYLKICFQTEVGYSYFMFNTVFFSVYFESILYNSAHDIYTFLGFEQM